MLQDQTIDFHDSKYFMVTEIVAILSVNTIMKRAGLCITIAIMLTYGCARLPGHATSIIEECWGEKEGKRVNLFTLTNRNGMVIKVSSFGATLTYVSAPDMNGNFEPVVLGFDSLKMYMARHPNFGSTVGRYANRIGGAQFTLCGTLYKLAANNGVNAIHGGPEGFSKKIFDTDTTYVKGDSSVVVLKYLSPDMEEGYPGTLTLRLKYILTNDNEIILDYEAATNKPTVINLTNHTYFNLTGCKENVLGHVLTLAADSISEVDSTKIPTGRQLTVIGTPYDFIVGKRVGERIEEVAPGYDINYKLRKEKNELTFAAEVYDPVSGRMLQAYTTEPCLQLYSANSDLGRYTGHSGIRYGRHYGLCLEMQHYPDSPNKPQFPDTVLEPGERYRQLTIYKFSVKSN
jgi:aldose 1-epimerase